MTLMLKILPRAADDVQCIFDYLAKHSPQGAADWWDAFDSAAQEATRGLVEHPLAPRKRLDSVRNQASDLQDSCGATLPIRFHDR